MLSGLFVPPTGKTTYDAPVSGAAVSLVKLKPLTTQLTELIPIDPATIAYKPKPSGSVDGYIPGQCVWGVARWVGVPAYMGSAYEWDNYARANGIKISPIPEAGTVGQTDAGRWGHVVLVLKVEGDKIYLREQNYDYSGSIRERWAAVSEFPNYIYF